MMKLLGWFATFVLFVIFFGFAVENTQEATLHFFLNYEIHGPLVLILLGFFAVGAVSGVLAMTSTVFRHRRDLSRHKAQLTRLQQDSLLQQPSRSRDTS
jgi:uncharacterized integral membrane protein